MGFCETMEAVRVSEWLKAAEDKLSAAGVDSPRLDAQLIAAHVLGLSRSFVLARPEWEVEPAELDPLLERRIQREPLAYILGLREFYGRPFRVDRAVLIPRQESETLVDAFIELETRESTASVLDLGVGSGCIAVTLKLECWELDVTASDVSSEALRVAEENAKRLQATGIRFVLSDGFSALEGRRFGVIVTNPPYVACGDALPPEIHRHEPHEALYSGPTGMEFFERLAQEAPHFLTPGGFVLTEVGDGQADAVREVFRHHGWKELRAFRDLGGAERALAFKFEAP
jgi:release factor glutamine methyltransferase